MLFFNPHFTHKEQALRCIVGNNYHILTAEEGQNQDLNLFNMIPQQLDVSFWKNIRKQGFSGSQCPEAVASVCFPQGCFHWGRITVDSELMLCTKYKAGKRTVLRFNTN